MTGTPRLAWLALRRDRLQLAIWLIVLTGLLAASAAVTLNEYQSAADRETAARLLAASPALLMLRGAPADASEAALIMVDIPPIVAALLGVMTVLAVVRNTRHNEETGRAELIGATAVGRWAMLSAALIVAVAASLALGGLFAGVLIVSGLDVGGAIGAGAAMASVGICFAGIAGLTAQLTSTARAASGLALATLGAAYLLRGLGDVLGQPTADGTSVTPAWPAWLSPFGWAQQLDPFGDARWWLLAPPLILAAMATTIAFAIRSRRDLGAGIIPASRGPAGAGPTLRSALGLAWRLQRGMLLAWAIGLGLLAAVFGSLGQQIRDMADIEQFAEILRSLAGGAGEMADLFFALVMTLIGLGVATYAVQALLVLRAEEADGRLEPVAATAVSRWRWLGSHLAFTLAGVIALLALSGLAAAAAYGAVTGEPGARLGELLTAALVQAPAAAVLAALAVAAFGLVPRLAPAVTWAALLAAILMGLLGDMLSLPSALRDLSPFSHVPALPAADFDAAPLVVLLALSAALVALGAVAFRRRDIALRA